MSLGGPSRVRMGGRLAPAEGPAAPATAAAAGGAGGAPRRDGVIGSRLSTVLPSGDSTICGHRRSQACVSRPDGKGGLRLAGHALAPHRAPPLRYLPCGFVSAASPQPAQPRGLRRPRTAGHQWFASCVVALAGQCGAPRASPCWQQRGMPTGHAVGRCSTTRSEQCVHAAVTTIVARGVS